ncbi:MAG TPA: response regulator transcription factor [Saprospiraceae bacterium]|nr:response regulator transcription factor [Saprospiraceae bacterium]
MAIRICIVEDMDEVREGLASLLRFDDRFDILGAFADAEQAMGFLKSSQPDIVIMDINLPGMSGIACIRSIKPVCPDTQFMMFTIYDNDEKVFEALAAGANGYLLKKTPFTRIGEALVELHEGGAPMSTNIARKVLDRMRPAEPSSSPLSSREHEVLSLLSRGLLYKEIAHQLGISANTVRQHIHNIYRKLHVQNKVEAINKTYGRG